MKKLILLCACLWALAAPLHAVAAPPEVIVVRVQEIGSEVTAVLTRGEGKSEVVRFNRKGVAEASEGYYKLIDKLYQEGYKLQSTFSSSQGFYTTLVFVKG